ncbi:MAG: undecaprenyldiphospho-muramoylpentapeptide beta-N-acetylglucosaminyltransferase [Flammeovirgaceae bacterium TMED290]|nr:MAG: undecaprenyldiphospho-muramoylpentapeptide beta-N-acetylglucosaminyltransferase [Flammeovirgaceae bacterium TMED290]
MHRKNKIKVILCGGGTGGHIFPMISVANELKSENKENEILFVGSRDRMEMEIVPKHNFKIIGLWISGIKRSSVLLNILFAGIPFLLQNFLLPFKLSYSILRSIYILYTFKPDFVIGFGGYSSGPFVFISNFLKFKTAIQEQNSSMGLTNKLLVNRVDYVFVAYEKLKKIYPNKPIHNFGNPIRGLSFRDSIKSYEHFKLEKDKKTVLVLGGSLGAKSINDVIINNISLIRESSYQILWQTGKSYYDEIKNHNFQEKNLVIKPFIDRMDFAYSVADLIISRAGAIAISELCVVAKPLILIPSPNVVDDHQTKNALEISERGGCLFIKDSDAKDLLMNKSIEILEDQKLIDSMKANLRELSMPNASSNIVEKIYESL